MLPSPPPNLNEALKQLGQELGFAQIGVAPAARPDTFGHFQEWLRQGFHGTMEYLPRREEAYAHPQGVQVGAKSIIIASINYGPGSTRTEAESNQNPKPTLGKVAAYAQGSADYHEVLRDKLQLLAMHLHTLCPTARTRIAVDTAPLLERDAARKAGLGWFGKNTMLINKHRGSYYFLGAILTDIEIPPDAPHATDHCGTCTRCLTACPTDAFEAPYVLNASRCISYLTIELRQRPIPMELRAPMGDWLFGCDICQQVCPWNRKAADTTEPAFKPGAVPPPDAAELLTLTEEEFTERYRSTPFERPGRAGMARNAAIVLGNQKDPENLPLLRAALRDSSALVRGAAAWALGETPADEVAPLLRVHLKTECDVQVREEITIALQKAEHHRSSLI